MSNTDTPEQMIDQILFGNAEVVDVSSTDHQFSKPAKSLYVGVAVTVIVDMGDSGNSISFIGVQAGTILPIFVDKIISHTVSAAASILGLR